MIREVLRMGDPRLWQVSEPVANFGTPELAGLGIAAAVLSTLVNVSIFLAYGTTAAVARMLGANDLTGALRAGIDGCWLAILIGAATLGVGWPLTPWIVERFGPAPDVADHAETYLQISLLGIPPMLLVLAATGVLRGLQDTRTPLYVAGSGAAGNVVLNVILVHGLGLGIAGSAIGTVIAQIAMATAFIIIVLILAAIAFLTR
jgi:putative MATE family efflux protein